MVERRGTAAQGRAGRGRAASRLARVRRDGGDGRPDGRGRRCRPPVARGRAQLHRRRRARGPAVLRRLPGQPAARGEPRGEGLHRRGARGGCARCRAHGRGPQTTPCWAGSPELPDAPMAQRQLRPARGRGRARQLARLRQPGVPRGRHGLRRAIPRGGHERDGRGVGDGAGLRASARAGPRPRRPRRAAGGIRGAPRGDDRPRAHAVRALVRARCSSASRPRRRASRRSVPDKAREGLRRLGGPPGALLGAVRGRHQHAAAVHPEPAQRLGLPRARPVADPRQAA